MALPTYQIGVLAHTSGDLLTVLDFHGLTLRYSRQLNGVGSMALTFDRMPVEAIETLFALDNFIEIQREGAAGTLVVEETYLVRQVHRFISENRLNVVIGAQSLNHLLKRRVIDPADDPLEAGGYSTKAGDCAAVMRAYVREQCADLCGTAARVFPGLSVPAPLSPTGENVGDRLRFKNLLTTLQDFSKQAPCDFHIARDTGADMEMFIGRIGSDKTKTTNYPIAPFVYVTNKRGNLSNPSYDVDRTDEQNYVYAQGQGQGSARKLVATGSDGTDDSPFNRIEFTVDANQSEKSDTLALLGEARKALFDAQAIKKLTVSPSGREVGLVYRQDWDLGDIVTVEWDGVETDLRVVGIQVDLSADGEAFSVDVEQYERT